MIRRSRLVFAPACLVGLAVLPFLANCDSRDEADAPPATASASDAGKDSGSSDAGHTTDASETNDAATAIEDAAASEDAATDSGVDEGDATLSGDAATADAATAIEASAPGFAAVGVPQTLSLDQGTQAPVDINIERAGGFAGAVTLSFPSLPAGVTVTPSTLTIPAGATSGPILVQIATNASTGAASISLHAVSDADSGALTSDGALALTVTAPVGGLDTTFGTNGGTVASPTMNGVGFSPVDAAVQSTGAIVAVGNFQSQPAIVRLTAAGALDTTFGGGSGYVTIPMSGITVNGIVVQSNDSIVVAYSNNTGGGAVRYLVNGAVDTTFGTNGVVTIANAGFIAVALQTDGDIVLGGVSTGATPSLRLARLTSVGVLDATFGTAGIVGGASGAYPYFHGLAVTSAGIVVASLTSLALQRFTSAGQIDATFGTAGTATPFGNESGAFYGVVVDPAGKLLAYGNAPSAPSIVRLTTTGALDTTFGTSGVATVPAANFLFSLVLAGDGTILVGGEGTAAQREDDDFVGRFTSNGNADPSFDKTGYSFVSPDPRYSSAVATLLPPASGKLVAIGTSNAGIGVVRINL